MALLACSPGTPHAAAPAANRQVVWQYEVGATDRGVENLAIEASFAIGASDELRVDDEATSFVHDVVYAVGDRWRPASSRGSTWIAPCRTRGCRVRYRFALREAAEKLDNVDTAIASGDAFVAPPSTWLLRPTLGSSGRLRFHVSIGSAVSFATGTRPSPDRAPDTYEAGTDAIDESTFAIFGAFDSGTITSDAARVEVAIGQHALSLADEDVLAWIRTAVDAIAAYFGRFPVDRTLVIVLGGQRGPTRGKTLGGGGAAVLVRAGEGVNRMTTRDDWVVTHELLHVVMPELSREHIWLGEGIPSYVEPIIRARAGLLSPEKFWRDLVEGLPQGLPKTDDEGLERTHTWGRTYWGGALFCFLADLMIRQRTADARSLDDALRAVVAKGANVETQWDIGRLLDVADRATATHVLHDLYRDMALAPRSVDLGSIWAGLGVRVDGKGVAFDDQAPLAAIRRSITATQTKPVRN